MGADTTTLIICIIINDKLSYLVYQVQAVENFEDFNHLISYLVKKGINKIKWTNNLDKALRIALYINRKYPAKYGICEFRNHINRMIRISDNCELAIER
tara:strand:+ start:365 stop:661 length:297 start_codon:yes stop_codon:yes gene_type:complete